MEAIPHLSRRNAPLPFGRRILALLLFTVFFIHILLPSVHLAHLYTGRHDGIYVDSQQTAGNVTPVMAPDHDGPCPHDPSTCPLCLHFAFHISPLAMGSLRGELSIQDTLTKKAIRIPRIRSFLPRDCPSPRGPPLRIV